MPGTGAKSLPLALVNSKGLIQTFHFWFFTEVDKRVHSYEKRKDCTCVDRSKMKPPFPPPSLFPPKRRQSSPEVRKTETGKWSVTKGAFSDWAVIVPQI